MRWFCLALLLASCSSEKPKPVEVKQDFFKVDPTTSSTIRGSIRYTGRPEKAIVIDMDQDPDCKKLYENGRRTDDAVIISKHGKVANVFVYIKSGLEGKSFAPQSTSVRIDQKGCWFQPRVIGLQNGQQLEVTNSDPVTHNIHPQSQVNREWNQSQAPEDQPIRRRFAQPEIMIRVKCNVHKWMRAWIGVVGNPYFAVTGPDGQFELKNVPPGKYTLVAWHETLGTSEQTLTIGPSSSSKVDFQFDRQ